MRKILVVVVVLFSSIMLAQRGKILSGNISKLKEITEYNLTFDYSNLNVDRVSEEQFLIDKMKKRQGNGKDIAFKNNWFADRENRYEPKFIESFTKRFKDSKVKVSKNLSTAKYTMEVKTTWIHPGFNVGIMHNSSLIKTIVTVYETFNPENKLVSIEYDRAPGKGKFAGPLGFLDYNSGYRISEAYAKLAKTLAVHIKKGKV
jgi:hypothetical protein